VILGANSGIVSTPWRDNLRKSINVSFAISDCASFAIWWGILASEADACFHI